jgi:hypothetical protein
MWDAATGDTVADPFTGYTKSARSVAFSPDGQRIPRFGCGMPLQERS